MTYQDFKNEWLGRRVDYDHVYGFQCVDLVLEYVKEVFGIASGVTGNAIDYWNRTSPALLTQFDRVQTTDVHPGDIVVLNGLSGNPYGHIGVCDSQDAANVTILEQNGQDGSGSGLGGNAVRLRAIPKSRVAGVLRPSNAALHIPDSPHGNAQVVREAYVRVAPNTSAALGGSQLLHPGETFAFQSKVQGQQVNQNGVNTNIWYYSSLGHYVWSGNCKDI